MNAFAGVLDRDELEARRYRGMNPAFVRQVWAKRRREQPAVVPLVETERPKPSVMPDNPRVDRLREQMARGGAKAIIAEVALEYGVTVEDIVGPRRFQQIVTARHKAIEEVSSRMPHLSLSQLGRIFKRDHTTIFHAIDRKHRRR